MDVPEGILTWSVSWIVQNKSHLVNQSSILANVGSDGDYDYYDDNGDNSDDDDAVLETVFAR